MSLKILTLIFPSEQEAHHHMENVFIESLINVAVKELLANEGENFSVMPPIHVFIFYRWIFWIFRFDLQKICTNWSDLKNNKNQRKSIGCFQRRILTHFKYIAEAYRLILDFRIIATSNTVRILTFAHSFLLNFVQSLY